MKRFIKSLKEKRGSVLFMVLSLMSLMIIIASAIYFTVLSSRQTQLTDYYDEQAYQTALSVSDVLTEYIRGASATDGISMMISGLTTVGQTVSTGNNDFLAFGGSKENLAKLGAFKVDITYNGKVTSGSTEYKVYDVAVTSDYNGIEETIHTIMNFYEGTSNFPGFDKFFTATGYSTGDVYLESGFIASDAFFDNEYTMFRGKYEATGSQTHDIMNIWGSIHCGGSLIINKTGDIRKTECPIDVIVGNNLTMNGNSTVLGEMKNGRIYIGGDCTITGSTKIENCGGLYVLGNLTIEGSSDSSVKANEIYVGGNLSMSNCSLLGKAYVNGTATFNNCNLNKEVYCNDTNSSSGNIKYKAQNASGRTDAWVKAGNSKLKISQDRTLVEYENNGTYYYNTVTDVTKLIRDITTVSLYPDWQPAEPTDSVTINFDSASNKCTYYIKSSVVIDDITMDDNMAAKTIPAQNFTAGALNIKTDNNNTQCIPTIVIYNDSTDALVVKLKGNCKTNTADDTFCWAGADDEGKPREQTVNVIAIGSGPVILNLDGDTKYVQNSYDFIGHLGFYSMFTSNDTQCTGKAYQQYLEALVKGASAKYGMLPYYARQIVNTNLNGAQYQNYNEFINQFVSCLNYTVAEVNAHNTAGHCGYYDTTNNECKHFGCLNPTRVQAYITSKGLNIYCPNDMHNNIFIVSTVKNADVKFEGEHAFFGGFIYSPYMTYDTSQIAVQDKGYTIAGGMIVSDYSIADQRGYIFFKPTVDLQSLSGFGVGGALPPTSSRTWKTIGH